MELGYSAMHSRSARRHDMHRGFGWCRSVASPCVMFGPIHGTEQVVSSNRSCDGQVSSRPNIQFGRMRLHSFESEFGSRDLALCGGAFFCCV